MALRFGSASTGFATVMVIEVIENYSAMPKKSEMKIYSNKTNPDIKPERTIQTIQTIQARQTQTDPDKPRQTQTNLQQYYRQQTKGLFVFNFDLCIFLLDLSRYLNLSIILPTLGLCVCPDLSKVFQPFPRSRLNHIVG